MYAEDFEFLDTLVHIHMHMVTAHSQDYNDGTYCECTTNYGFSHVKFVWSITHIRF